jgi:hypothetical protein
MHRLGQFCNEPVLFEGGGGQQQDGHAVDTILVLEDNFYGSLGG